VASEIAGGSGNSQSCDANLTHVDSPSGFTRIFILHENIHKTRAVTLFAGGLDTISKNNVKEITLIEDKAYINLVPRVHPQAREKTLGTRLGLYGINSLILDLLLAYDVR